VTTTLTQATVHEFDAGAGTGSIITDEGLVIPFAPEAWEAGPLRTMRPGQRVRVVLEAGSPSAVVAITLATFPDPR
jgi:cold shock CspA family protein